MNAKTPHLVRARRPIRIAGTTFASGCVFAASNFAEHLEALLAEGALVREEAPRRVAKGSSRRVLRLVPRPARPAQEAR